MGTRKPGFGTTRQLSSGRFQARYTGPDKNRYKAEHTFSDELDALAWLAGIRKQIDLGTWQPPTLAKPSIPSVEDLTKRWLDLCKADGLRPTSLATYEAIADNRILCYPELAQLSVDKVDAQAVARWWGRVVEDHPTTTDRNKRAYGKLKTILELGVEYGYLEHNPVHVRAARRQPQRKNKTLPNTEELLGILEHSPSRYKFAVCMTLFHGLRVGEALGLRTEHIVMTTQGLGIRIEGTMQRLKQPDTRTRMHWQPMPKTQAGYRVVPVLSDFLSLVRHTLENTPEGELLTTTNTGEPVMDTSFRSVFHRAKAKAGASEEITPHYGRNWLITRLAEAGATPKEIGAVLGQSDLSTIVGVYMKVRETRPAELMSRVSVPIT